MKPLDTRPYSTFLLLSMLVFLGFSQSVAQAPVGEPVNANSDFSDAEVGQSADILGWLTEAGGETAAIFEIAEDPEEAGNNVMSIEVTDFPSGSNSYDIQIIGVTEDGSPFVMVPGDEYEVSLRVRTGGGEALANVTVGNPDFGEYWRTSSSVAITDEWQEFTYTFTNEGYAEDFNDTEGRMPLHFGFEENIEEVIYVDDVQLVRLAPTSTEPQDTPANFSLEQNYPNPFNPTTSISYEIGQSGPVTLEVFNVLGKRVATLVNAQAQPAGSYTVSFDAANLSSGVYMYRLSTEAQSITRTMTLTK
ncbi:MAG: T9SS type A sorting domain-containing protein [Cyclonatronaceae bacterium]